MEPDDKNGQNSPYPPYYYSVKYYTDPFDGTEANCGCDDQEEIEDLTGKKDKEAPDEPIESWGWINNID